MAQEVEVDGLKPQDKPLCVWTYRGLTFLKKNELNNLKGTEKSYIAS